MGREQLRSYQRNVLSGSICSVGFVLLTSLCCSRGGVLLLILFYTRAHVWILAACTCRSLGSCVCLCERAILHRVESVFPVPAELEEHCPLAALFSKGMRRRAASCKKEQENHAIAEGEGEMGGTGCFILWQRDLKTVELNL